MILDFIRKFLEKNNKNARFITETLIKNYGDPEPLEIGLYDGSNPIADVDIGIEINNKQYIKKTNENGIASLNINLSPNKYTAKLYFPGNNEYNNVTGYVEVFVKGNTYMEAKDVNKTFGDDTKYQTVLYDSITGKRIHDEVIISVNGKEYKKTANNEGLYELAINLGVGTYTITSTFNGNDIYNSSSVMNTIVVKESGGNPQPSGNKKQIILGCDSNSDLDSVVQNRIAERLEQEGYPVEKLSINPNAFASYDWSGQARGKIGVYLIASGLFSIADAWENQAGFDNYIFGIRSDFGDKGATCFDCRIRPDADCTSICDKFANKTFNEINQMVQPKIAVVGGESTERLADNMIDWLRALEKREQETPQEPEHSGTSTELYEYFTEQGGGYLGQKTSYTCAPHSLMQCFRRLTGEDVSEMTLASVCGTTTEGTDHDGINTGVAWFNREYNQNIKIDWYNFSELGNNQDERFAKVQEMINNGAVFFHLLYRNQWGHYEVIKEAWDDPLVILNSLGDSCGNGYCGYIEYRSRSEQVSYINGISQKSVAYLHY